MFHTVVNKEIRVAILEKKELQSVQSIISRLGITETIAIRQKTLSIMPEQESYNSFRKPQVILYINIIYII